MASVFWITDLTVFLSDNGNLHIDKIDVLDCDWHLVSVFVYLPQPQDALSGYPVWVGEFNCEFELLSFELNKKLYGSG